MRNKNLAAFALLITSGLIAVSTVTAQQTLPPPPLDEPQEEDGPQPSVEGLMTPLKLADLIQRIDPDAIGEGNSFTFRVEGRPLRVVFDETADRMRIITPIVGTDGNPPELIERAMQANFDAVLDARYAIANEQVWSVFIHPLGSLTSKDFISGVAQTTIAAQTFGTTFSSGVFVFGGGDSQELHEDLQRRLEDAARGNDERGI